MNGIDFLDRGWSLAPDRHCLVDGVSGESLTYSQVRDETFRTAAALRREGFGIGAKASVLSHNAIDGFLAVLSIMRSGMTYIPVNSRNLLDHNAAILDRFDCDALFVRKEHLGEIERLRELAPGIKRFICLDGSAPDVPSIREWAGSEDATPFDLPHDAERAFEILPTSATTGFPKGVIFPNRILESIVANFRAVAPVDTPPVFLAVAPLTHLSGKFMNYVMSLGGTGVIVPNADREAILRLIPAHKITHLFLPPTIIYDLLALPDVDKGDYSSLRYFMYSAAPMAPAKLAEAIAVFGPVMCQIYGQSEAAWVSAMLPEDHMDGDAIASAERLASCGRPLPFVVMGVMDDDGRLLPPGERGEIVVRGNNVMPGYYKDPEQTAAAFDGGWLRTGDIGYTDADGFYYLVDRKRDMIISGGFNIYSVEVEAALLQHPDIQDVAVVSAPDERWGEIVVAHAEGKPGRTLDPGDLIAFCRDQIGAMKSPKRVYLESLPRSPIGKILKRDLRDRHWGASDRKVN